MHTNSDEHRFAVPGTCNRDRFAAKQIGAFKCNGTTAGAGHDAAGPLVGITGDLRLRDA